VPPSARWPSDSHTVYALSVANGRERWSFTVDGRVDSTPTIYKGMVLFGSADGCVNSLRAKDGVLAWKFLAAPEIRLVSSYGQLESVWPVHGSVLIQNDVVYTSAGRNTYLDDGITFYKLDPATGNVLNKNVLYNFDPETGAQLGPEGGFDMDGVNTDILSGDGENVFMKQERLDGSLQKGAKGAPHLFGVHGFLGEEWFVRSYWLLGTNVRAGWGAWASGNETRQLPDCFCFQDSLHPRCQGRNCDFELKNGSGFGPRFNQKPIYRCPPCRPCIWATRIRNHFSPARRSLPRRFNRGPQLRRQPGWRCRVRYFGLTEMGHLRYQ